jgi:hypothetical protein
MIKMARWLEFFFCFLSFFFFQAELFFRFFAPVIALAMISLGIYV